VGSGSDPIAAPVAVVSAETAEFWRVLNGEPRLGVDLTDSTIPSETGLQSVAIAFGKGCYTGQELVERIDSRGRVVRSLMRLRSDAPLQPGTPLTDDAGADRGVVTSAAQLPDSTWVGIGLVRTAGGQPIMANGCALTTLALLLDDA
jgi:tRNA-modifying protein YgfZ